MKKKLLSFYFTLLAFFARKYIKKHKPFVIGVNWSVGKTSSRMIIYQTLNKFVNNKKIYTSQKNFNWELWLSLSIFQVNDFKPNFFSFFLALFNIILKYFFSKKPYDIIILEYWIDRPWEMDFLLSILKPNIWVFTAIDSVHSLQFWNPANIAKEEKKMIKNTLDFAFLNSDDNYAMALSNEINIDYLTYQTLWYEQNWDISFSDEKFLYEDDTLLVNFKLKVREKEIEIKTNVLWKAHYGYIWVALAILDIVSYKDWKTSILDKFDDLFLEYKLQCGRFSVFAWIWDSLIFDSTYNSSPISFQKVLNTVNNVKKGVFSDSEIRLMLWDMRELWDLTESEHRKVSAYANSLADRVFLVWDSMNEFFKDELQKTWFDMSLVHSFKDSISLWEFVKKEINRSDKMKLIVWKGSQNGIFLEEAIKNLLKNNEDISKLTRQSDWWLKKKRKYFLKTH